MSILLGFLAKLAALSLIAFGGVNALLPTIFDIAVNQEHWIDAQTFSDYFALAQAAPGPNFMIIALLGWHVSGIPGAFLATLAIALPSSVLIFFLQRIILGIQDPIKKQTIQYAAAALAIGLIFSSVWHIALQINHGVATYALTIITIGLTVFTRWHPLYWIAIGAALGAFGLL